MTKIIIDVFITDNDTARVDLDVDNSITLIEWMAACECLINRIAQDSPAGYERTVELLCKGAMTYRKTKESRIND